MLLKRGRGVARWALLAALAVLAACGDEPFAPKPSPLPLNDGLLVTAAPEDRHLFVSWNRVNGADHYAISTSPGTATLTIPQSATSVISAVLPGLVNGQRYALQITALKGSATLVMSAPAVGIPRARPNCAWSRYMPWDRRQSVFCSFEAMDDWLRTNGVSALSLRCQGAVVTRWDLAAPDCLYQTQAGDQLLLMRSADNQFTPDRAYRDPTVVRQVARHLLWPSGDPFGGSSLLEHTPIPAATGKVTDYASAQSYRVQITPQLASRVTIFKPRNPVSGRYAIYHEGHGAAGVEQGAETIEWLLARGWEVVALDLPMNGLNYVDIHAGLTYHQDLQQFEGGHTDPVTYFFSPVKDVVDRIVVQSGGNDPDILLIGRSGGGWLSYVYGALDPRIDAVVSVAGGTPLSQRLGATWIGDGLEALELGDYEQVAPRLYSVVRHEDLMLAAGSRGFLAMFNQYDPCCFRLNPGSEFASWLVQGARAGSRVEFFLDTQNDQHSIGSAGFVVLESFLGKALPR